MHRRTRVWAGVLTLGTACAFLTPALGHDLKGVVIQYRQTLKRTAAEQSRNLNPSTIQRVSTATNLSPRVLRSVLEPLALWPEGHKISICFLGGGKALRSRVVSVITRKWPVGTLTAHHLDYDSSFTTAPLCGDPPAADIKVSFLTGSEFGGYWSYVGVESLKHTPSMNLENFTATKPAEPKFSRLVAHEMGHALGLDHEHQSPAAPDCTWDYDALRSNYSWVNDEDMHFNIDKLQKTMQGRVPKYQFSAYDRKSVMHYFFDPVVFKKGAKDPCYSPNDNDTPSEEDLKGIGRAYGVQLEKNQLLTIHYGDAISRALGAKYADVQSLIQVKKAKLSSETNQQILRQLDLKP